MWIENTFYIIEWIEKIFCIEVAPVDKEVDDGNNINCEAEVTNENFDETSVRFLATHLLFIEAKYDLPQKQIASQRKWPKLWIKTILFNCSYSIDQSIIPIFWSARYILQDVVEPHEVSRIKTSIKERKVL